MSEFPTLAQVQMRARRIKSDWTKEPQWQVYVHDTANGHHPFLNALSASEVNLRLVTLQRQIFRGENGKDYFFLMWEGAPVLVGPEVP